MYRAFLAIALAAVSPAGFAQQKHPPTYKVDAVQKINSEVYQLVYNPGDGNIYVAGPKAGFNRQADNFVYVLSGKDLAVKDSINVGKNLPFGIGLNTRTQTLYVGHSIQNSVSAIDLKTKKQTIIPGGKEKGKIREIVVDETRNLVYVSDHGNPSVWVIDGKTNTLVQSIDHPGAYLIGLNVDPARERIYATDGDTMEGNILVFDSKSRTLVDKYKTWSYCPMNIAVDYKSNRIFVSQSNDNNITIVDGNTGQIINKVYLGYDSSPIGLVYDEKTNLLYTANRSKKEVAVVDMESFKVKERIPTGGLPNTISLDKETGLIYVTNKNAGRGKTEEKLENANTVIRISRI